MHPIDSNSFAPASHHPSHDWVLDDFDYALPESLIAQHPLAQRPDSRLLVPNLPGHIEGFVDSKFSNLGQFLRPGDLLVMNNTRVIAARLLGHKKDTGGHIELLVERILSSHEALVMLRSSKPPGPGVCLAFGPFQAVVVTRQDNFYQVRFEQPIDEVLKNEGHVPLPPYITHADEPADHERYQTVYAKVPGAVAAPTAGLHFDEPLIASLASLGVNTAEVTLHVGAGTFQPVRVQRIAEHKMHSEWYQITQQAAEQIKQTRKNGGRIIAVGTTALRTLESAALAHGEVTAGQNDTQLFVTPGFRFRIVDALITNFHLPKSTLMMLVSAFAGVTLIRSAYAHAIDREYRFFSYGDAMLLHREQQGATHA